jgi:rubredoxin
MQNPDSDLAQKKDEADRLRAAEKFMKVGTGEAFCRGCGYEYKPGKGDPEYPISAGTYFTVRLSTALFTSRCLTWPMNAQVQLLSAACRFRPLPSHRLHFVFLSQTTKAAVLVGEV